jgi:hypothetical protein
VSVRGDGTGSGSYSMTEFSISGTESLGSAAKELLNE